MLQLKNEKVAIPVVLFAGLLWSFGPLSGSLYESTPILVPWQYLFTRGSNNFLYFKYLFIFLEGKNFYKNYL